MTGGFYYAPPDSISDETIELPQEESRHALKVMRASLGDQIQIVDGAGGWYRAEICELRRGSVSARILARARDVGEPAYRLTVGLGILKHQGRFETFLEKAVELGVTRIVPIQSQRTQKGNLNRDRLRRVMISGLKQSMRSRIPELAGEADLENVITDDRGGALRFIAHESAEQDASLLSHTAAIQGSDEIAILIGPEGGFTDPEIELARAHDWKVVSLGTSRLRAETAGISASAAIHMIKSTNQNHGSD